MRTVLRSLVCLLCGLGVLTLGAASAESQSAAGPLPPDRRTEWTIAEGFGFTLNVNRGHSHELALYALPALSVRLSSRFEWLFEGHVAHFFSPGGYMVGVMPIGGRLYIGNGRVLPYATIGGGLGWTNLVGLEEIDQRFNFLLQIGAGLRWPISDDRAWTLEARGSHISNAGMTKSNLGHNQLVVIGGFRFR